MKLDANLLGGVFASIDQIINFYRYISELIGMQL